MRIVHLSDIHFWRLTTNPRLLISKRVLGVIDLARGRARKFRLERIEDVVARIQAVDPDHLLITGDLTTTAMPAEFDDALQLLGPLLRDPARVSVVPGNHDRYTWGSFRNRLFEKYLGRFMPQDTFPWLRVLDAETGILGLDPTRSHISARGYLPPLQLAEATALLERQGRPTRLIVACHYPLVAPAAHTRELAIKRLSNQKEVLGWFGDLGPHLYCCGHVHVAWAFTPPVLPDQLCLNAGAPLYRDRKGRRLPGFLDITLEGPDVRVVHHAWSGDGWIEVPLWQRTGFLGEIPLE